MRRNFVGVVAASVAGVALLPGCSVGSSGDPPAPAAPTGSAAHPTRSTSPGAYPTNATSGAVVPRAVLDRLPPAARASTPDGARAYVDFYVESINTAFEEPSDSALQGLSALSCDVCTALQTRASQFADSGQHYTGPIYRTRGSSASAEPPGQKVVVDIEQLAVATVDRDGKEIDLNHPSQARFSVSLEFTNAWQVTRWAEVPTSTA
ncbi:MAG: hypothetical protein ABI112_01435 [Terracoccus sp.]